jgi:1,4-dihydroxy-2-naphthoate polyprenyltransferase
MSQFLTLAKDHPDIQSYLEGTFSGTQRALPIESLNVRAEPTQITFQLINIEDIKRPLWIAKWFQVLKARNLLLVVFPIFLVFIDSLENLTLLDPLTFAASACGAVFLLIAANLRNDYQDHISGLDRIHQFSGGHAIQKGWVTGQQMRAWSHFYLFLGVLAGARALWLYPETILIAGIMIVLIFFGMSTFSSGHKHRLWSEWMIFLMLGPLLTMGMQFSTGSGFSYQSVVLGTISGWLAVFFLHLKNFEQLMIIDKAQFANTIWWLGFERARVYLLFWAASLVAAVLLFQSYFASKWWLLTWSLCLSFLLWPYFRSLRSLQSPLGSGVKRASQLGRAISLSIIALFIFQNIWKIWQ